MGKTLAFIQKVPPYITRGFSFFYRAAKFIIILATAILTVFVIFHRGPQIKTLIEDKMNYQVSGILGVITLVAIEGTAEQSDLGKVEGAKLNVEKGSEIKHSPEREDYNQVQDENLKIKK